MSSEMGDNGVGKTSFALQIYDPTIEDHYGKQLNVDNRMCLVEVIDPALQEEWGFRDSWTGQAALLVYSIASRALLTDSRGRYILILVGNKCDLEARREVSQEEGAALTLQLGCEFIETSAKTGHNVERAVAILSAAPAEIKSKHTKAIVYIL
ncbi:P-loop containing nucleoside triphosphate hydrolase protein [Mycena leptocephala]|nr:P-loop containing nucleoside triphosphate hydrolase protein [Mycena leptocephala]